ncbi:MAG TPA: alanine racemase, partial [Rhodocyclaceae bacterium]|nr:alanine racemase [Rhodocyclaceae bacterium]
MPRPIRATLNLAALVRNHSRVRSQIKEHGGKSQIWSVVKANAYGHGLARIAAALAPHTDGFALVEFEGAQALRDMGIRQPILMLEGCYSDVDLQRCVDLGLTTVVHSMAQAQALAAADLSTPVAIAVKLNTGMNRLGFNAVELHDALALLESSPQVGSLMLMTHFADADGPTGVSMPLVRLSEMTRGLSYPVSLANSAAILRYPETHADWVRPGIMLYGASPFPEVSAESLGLEPVMSLHSELLAVRDLQVGDSIGYGCAFVADKPMRVGIVACGYADGYPR